MFVFALFGVATVNALRCKEIFNSDADGVWPLCRADTAGRPSCWEERYADALGC
jgi:hypothetical protein